MTHTPGPWIATGWKNTVVNAPNGNTLCLAPSDEKGCPLERIQANARLIAAAPDLLDACLRMRDRLTELANAQEACWLDWGGAYYVDAAIEKAQG